MKKNILIIDDNESFRNLTNMILAKDFSVRTAHDGKEGLKELASGYMPDLIVTDLVMPEVDGEVFIKKIKANKKFQHIPVIVLSSIDKSTEKVKLIKAGADDYLAKPYNPDELLARIYSRLKLNA